MARKKILPRVPKVKLPPIKAPNTGFWDTFDKEILRKKKR